MSQSGFTEDKIFKILDQKLKDRIISKSRFKDLTTIEIKKEDILDVIGTLKNDKELQFSYLVDETVVDYMKFPEETPERFGIIYLLYSYTNDYRIKIRTFVSESDPEIDTLSGYYHAANWMEREIYDMFGIVFKDHPDLRRILLPDYYEGYPLRKDYPLEGRGERASYPKYHDEPWEKEDKKKKKQKSKK